MFDAPPNQKIHGGGMLRSDSFVSAATRGPPLEGATYAGFTGAPSGGHASCADTNGASASSMTTSLLYTCAQVLLCIVLVSLELINGYYRIGDVGGIFNNSQIRIRRHGHFGTRACCSGGTAKTTGAAASSPRHSNSSATSRRIPQQHADEECTDVHAI